MPYSCELVALRSLRAATFGILMSLEPAAAALVGIVVLGELLSALQWLAVVCVIAASIGATRQNADARRAGAHLRTTCEFTQLSRTSDDACCCGD